MTADVLSRRDFTRLGARARRHWRSLACGVRRLSFGLADQAVSTITNFITAVYVARFLGAGQVGAFSVAYVTYAFALNAARGLATGPLMVNYSGTDLRTWRRAVADCTGTSLSVGLAAGACVLAAAVLISGAEGSDLLALGITLPGLMLQDGWRYSFFALGRGAQALINDLTWAAVLLTAMELLRVTNHVDGFWLMLAWGLAANVAAGIGLAQARVAPRLLGTFRWISAHRRFGPRYLVNNCSYGTGLMLGLRATGYIQAASTVMGPITVLFLGTTLIGMPECARLLRRGPAALRPFCLLVSGGLAVAAVAWGAMLLVALPRGLGAWLLGPIWRPAYPLAIPLTLFVAAQGLSAGASMGLASLGAADRVLRVTLVTSPLVAGCALAGALAGGTGGTLYASAAASWLAMPVGWQQLRAALRERAEPSRGHRRQARRPGRHRKAPRPCYGPRTDGARLSTDG